VTRALMLAVILGLGAEYAAAQDSRISNTQETTTVNRVHLKALDTLNGSTTDLVAQVGETVRFGRLEISADTCRVPTEDPKGDAYAFLRIRDTREEEPRFSGWMFASSPALSALDHPRYDVWVVSCDNG
jgi:hypothetical protein